MNRRSLQISAIAVTLGAALACGTPATDEGDGGGARGGQGGSGGGLGGAPISGSSGTGPSGGSGAAGAATGGAATTGGAAGTASGAGGTGAAPSGGAGAGGLPTGGNGGASGAGGSSGSSGAAGAGTGGAAGAAGCSTPPDPSPLVGWASVAGMNVTTTTGGGTATPQTVTTLAALNAAAAGNTAAVIVVNGKLAPGTVRVGSNKTIVGVCGAELHGHLDLSGVSNVIVRNLKIVGYGVGDCTLDPTFDAAVGCSSGEDAATIQNNSHHVWFDHCDISDGTDGNLDVTSGSDFVTISWTKFHYTSRADNVGNDSTGAEGHRFSNLIGSADNVPGDVGHLNITWHHDWWADNVNQRMPRSRYGKIHLFNNLFTSTGNSVCTNSGFQATLLVESSVYSNVRGPLQIQGGTMLARNNVFTNTSGGTTTATGAGFTPPYTFTPDAVAGVQAAVQAGAGPH